ncbi:aminotransferase class III-fold pyridoxal phosphate-dependent enzyme [Roseovarius sp. LXJ103]|uniref:aminotransferase class III-fold pyridoxal phosphate-dependent enzyme n=1 Tax=Roseovarius carneus TaxID=2853164 RepID=UPI000D61DAFE|nr:aminotransferase class III-fold pyridoxal phosphate-dependent enzyme [Roseovarius carneus]MBZ8118828.1 aminotransferase class III-fold pyridoxal phosphate-dependent enzyme [Roseovarius carneus]PWE35504.1 peptidase M23 [Pelagicola sp. LXJ1103]
MTTDMWAQALAKDWHITAQLHPLDGEYDLNFLAQGTDGHDHIVKVMRAGCAPELIDLQIRALEHIAAKAPDLPLPAVIRTKDGAGFAEAADVDGQTRLIWVLSKLSGRCYAQVAPKGLDLIQQVGHVLGGTALALADFDHPGLARDFKWNLMKADWIADDLTCLEDPSRRALIAEITEDFARIKPALAALPVQAIHNDANDYNILIEGGMGQALGVSGLIDLGDMCAAPRVCDLAIAAAYMVLDHDTPERAFGALIKGYHAANPLSPAEVDLIWPLLRARLAVSVVNSTLMARENPDDPYITISQAPAWRFLEGAPHDPSLVRARLRAACGLPVADGAERVLAWLETARGSFAPLMDGDLAEAPLGPLSIEHSAEPQDPFNLTQAEAALLGGDPAKGRGPWLGYYREPRLIYTDKAFRTGRWKASDRRSVHLGVDIFAPAGAAVSAPLNGEVVIAEYRADPLDYGGMIILRHETPEGDAFFTLYGHLDPGFLEHLSPGTQIAKGAAFCTLGTQACNGGWAPHLHFQLLMTSHGMAPSWPGVADPDDLEMWEALSPNPACLMNLPDAKTRYDPPPKAKVAQGRAQHFGGNLSLTYTEPVMLLRGWRHHMFDEWGRAYLDAYNNVPHVGHAHPRIQAVAAEQLHRINTNTRYLHPAQSAFAAKILSKLPERFEVCYFVNSGSEANELALRLARAHTGAKGMITPDHGYHGNTTGAVDISAYKFAKPGGSGKPDWVELVEVADEYRGPFRRDDPERADKFADLVDPAITALKARGHGLAGFIAETFPSVGGQIIPPKGYLKAVYAKIRESGGLCIADEVQTGLGRLGQYYFGFEQQEALPDMVVLGKPIGNGHPIGAVITTREIAQSFDNGIEFFSTFGGSTLSCRIGKEVLDIVDDEGLQGNAEAMGTRLMAQLRTLEARHACVGDVRGMGLFLGVELIETDGSESTAICAYVKNRMRDHRILIGSEGPKDNILKIRPPLTIEADDVDMITETLDKVLAEVALWQG